MTASRDLERLAGAVLCVGFTGDAPGNAPLEALAELGPGGVVLFSRNATSPAQTHALVASVRCAIEKRSGVRPFFAIDQEGGRVRRLRHGAHDVPPMMALGATHDEALAERVGRLLGADVRAAGLDVDFAPVMDLALRPGNTVIGNRAFGDDPAVVGELGAAVVRGIQSQGIAATLKHFPGHGATSADTHETQALVDEAAATVRARDLVPFVRGIAAGAKAVMVAHVTYSALDPGRPATSSRRIMYDLLRRELRFAGVCFTDCMEMDAVAKGVGTARAAVMAMQAGADGIVVSHTPAVARTVRDALANAVATGVLARERLEEAARRIARLARRDGDGPWPFPDASAAREAARSAVTVVRGAGLLLRPPVTVVSFEPAAARGAEDAVAEPPSLALALRRRRMHAELLRVPLEEPPATDQLLDLIRAHRDHDVVVLSRRAQLYSVERTAIDSLLAAAPHAILVSVLEPFDAGLFPQARTLLCTYGDDALMMDALADVLTGKGVRPAGRLPVHVSTPAS